MDIVINYSNSLKEKVRDLNILKYVLRSLDCHVQNVDNVFLIVESNDDIPEYLNINNIKIVTHESIIDPEFLPTTNKNLVTLSIPRIKDLNEEFLVIDTNCIINQSCKDNTFFFNNLPNMSFINVKDTVHADSQKCATIRKAGRYSGLCAFNNRSISFNKVNDCYDLSFENMKMPLYHHYSYLKSKCIELYNYIWNQAKEDSGFKDMIFTKDEEIRNIPGLLLYSMYHYWTDFYNIQNAKFKRVNLAGSTTADDIIEVMNNREYKAMSLNPFTIEEFEDLERIKTLLNDVLEERFPNKSKYEL